jgi:hypothetical protein
MRHLNSLLRVLINDVEKTITLPVLLRALIFGCLILYRISIGRCVAMAAV